MMFKFLRILFLAVVLISSSVAQAQGSDPLPSWNAGSSKKAIVDFVSRVTDSANPSFVPASERIATFDNDGTLWPEQPMYFQLLFALDRIRCWPRSILNGPRKSRSLRYSEEM